MQFCLHSTRLQHLVGIQLLDPSGWIARWICVSRVASHEKLSQVNQFHSWWVYMADNVWTGLSIFRKGHHSTSETQLVSLLISLFNQSGLLFSVTSLFVTYFSINGRKFVTEIQLKIPLQNFCNVSCSVSTFSYWFSTVCRVINRLCSVRKLSQWKFC